jgi:uncharacterized membrane protein YcaP (DUF421 family)
MEIDWQTLFVPQTSLVELVLRGTVMYLALFATLRVLVRRHVGSMSLMDLLLMVLIADAAQNAMAGEYKSLTAGLVLCGTLIGWNYLVDWLAYLFPAFGKLIEPPPLPIVQNGVLNRRNMRSELITEDELLSQLRQQDIRDFSEVKIACVEPDGQISVERMDGNDSKEKPKRATALR